MVSEWMTNGNILQYIDHNDSQRMQLVRGALYDSAQELTSPTAC